MKTRYFRLAMVGAFLLITQVIPDVPAVAWAQVRGVRIPTVRPPSGGRVRGPGCSGGARIAPKLPSGAGRAIPRLPAGARFVPARAGTRALVFSVLAASSRPAVAGRPLEALEANTNSLKALRHLRELVHGPWPKAVSAEQVKAGVVAYAQTASPKDAAVMRRYLALRAEMEGQPDVARRLLLPGEERDAQLVLRDLRVLEAISATPPPFSPLGHLPLPEPEPLSLKALVREQPIVDLEALVEDLPATELRARRGALRFIEISAGRHWSHVVLSLRHHKGATAVSQRDDHETEVERQLGRPLTPAEQLLVRRLLRNKTTAEVVAILRRMERK
jgi:hypothetical protein